MRTAGRDDRGGRLLDRRVELAAIAAAVEHATAGSGSVLYIEGPAGIGKSALLGVCAEIAEARGLTVLAARGDALVMESSFAAARELLWPLVRRGGMDQLEGAARFAIPVFELERPLGNDRDRISSVLHGLYWLIADLADSEPLVLLVDDAHWLDAASARFLEYLSRRCDALAVLIVVAVRRGESPAGSGLEAAMRSVATEVLQPGALSEDASGELVRAVLGSRADAELCRSCHEATRGNPFYLRQLADALAREGQRPTLELARRVQALGVGTIGASVLVRLARLEPECAQMARAVAILGPGTPLGPVASLAGLDLPRARAAVDRLHGAHILTLKQDLSFVHPIVGEAIAAQVPPATAAALHREAARLLAAAGAPSDRVAAHLLSADAVGDALTVEALRAAARDAVTRGAPEAAVSYLRRALAEPPERSLRLAVLVDLGRAEALLPMVQDFSALREAMDLADDPTDRASIGRELALALCGVLRNVEARALIEELLDQLEGQIDSTVTDSLALILIAIGSDDLEAAPRVHARAARYMDSARRGEVTDPRMLAALAVEASLTSSSAELATELALRALEDPRLIGEWLDSGYVTATVALSTAGALEQAAGAIDRGIAEAQRRGSAPMLLQLAIFRAEAALFAGDLETAEDYADRAAELGRALGSVEHAAVHAPVIHVERGRLEQAAAAVASVEPASTTVWGAMLLAERGRVRIAAGDFVRGLDDITTASARMRGAGLALSCFCDWMPAAVEALVQLGRGEDAIDLARAELAQATAFGSARRLGIALSVCGWLDPSPTGLEALREAVDVLHGSPARLEHARALVRLGIGLRRRGDAGGAREALAAGLDRADRCGGWALADEARAELVATGARPRRRRTSGPAALTPAELRAARMAAAGLSNREIAQALFVSTKTVEGHLSQAYAKLGVRSREALAGALDTAR